MANAINWFEIPVVDFGRAKNFITPYSALRCRSRKWAVI